MHAFQNVRSGSPARRIGGVTDTGSRDGPTWQSIVQALAGQEDALVARFSDRIQSEIASYREMDREVLDADVADGVQRALRLRLGESIDDAEAAGLAEAGERQALRGDRLEDLLRAWRIGMTGLAEVVREVGDQQGADPRVMLDLVVSFLSWSDQAAVAVATAHRRAELELARRDQERRGSLVRGVLLGTVPAAEVRVQLDGYRLDPAAEYHAVRARPAAGAEPSTIARPLGVDDAHLTGRGLLALLDGDVAGFLRRLPPGDLPGVVGVGPACPMERLGESFRLATRALATAEAFGLTGVREFGDLGLLPAILADRDVGKELHRRYVAPVGSTAAAKEVITSVRAYLAAARHIETAAAELTVHPNTVRYRLARFEELTGADLRDTRVAAEVWWVLTELA